MVNLNIGGDVRNDLRTMSARAVLDEGTNTPDRLEKAFSQNIAFMNVLIAAGAQLQDIPLDLIIKHSNIADKNEWSAFIQQRQQVHMEIAAQEQADAQMASVVNTANQIKEEPVAETKGE